MIVMMRALLLLLVLLLLLPFIIINHYSWNTGSTMCISLDSRHPLICKALMGLVFNKLPYMTLSYDRLVMVHYLRMLKPKLPSLSSISKVRNLTKDIR